MAQSPKTRTRRSVIYRDSFGRYDIIRRTIQTLDDCKLCGQNRNNRLFQYGTNKDDRNRDEWKRELFCSKSCHDQYWGQ